MSGRYVSFALGSGRYCVPVDQVMQIVRPDGVLRAPKAPPFVSGVITLHGDVIPVIRLAARLGLPEEEPGAVGPRARIIVARVSGRTVGLAVDDVSEIVEVDEAKIQRDTGEVSSELVQGAVQRGQDHLFILDLSRVLGAGRDLQGAAPV